MEASTSSIDLRDKFKVWTQVGDKGSFFQVEYTSAYQVYGWGKHNRVKELEKKRPRGLGNDNSDKANVTSTITAKGTPRVGVHFMLRGKGSSREVILRGSLSLLLSNSMKSNKDEM